MELTSRIEDGVGHLTLNRPDQMNALTVDVVSELGPAARRLLDEGARAIVLSGSGSTFCAGADLSLVKGALDGSTYEVLTPLVQHLHESLKMLRELPVPIVAAIEGPAVGAGLGLALSADLRVAGDGVRLVPGYMGIGSSPDGGVSYYLTRMLGSSRAVRLLMRNETVMAEQALELGLVDSVVARGSALQEAVALAREVSTAPPLALLRVRRLVDSATLTTFADHLDEEQRLVTELWDTADFREGVTAFLERRRPDFRGV